MNEACLYIVATPIGNMDDITLRALRILAAVDVVAAEDTRRTRALLSRHGLDRPLFTLQEHNEEQQAPRLISKLGQGESVALVSDAGTPLVSDPGYRLVKLAADAGINIVAVPGASSVTAALSISGLPTDRFVFEGFLPPRRTARLKRLLDLCSEKRTLVFFESSHRICESLADFEEVFEGGRQAAVCREMTKQFETVIRGSLAEIRRKVESDAQKSEDGFAQALQLARALEAVLPLSQAARVAAKFHGVSRRELYRALEGGG